MRCAWRRAFVLPAFFLRLPFMLFALPAKLFVIAVFAAGLAAPVVQATAAPAKQSSSQSKQKKSSLQKEQHVRISRCSHQTCYPLFPYIYCFRVNNFNSSSSLPSCLYVQSICWLHCVVFHLNRQKFLGRCHNPCTPYILHHISAEIQ